MAEQNAKQQLTRLRPLASKRFLWGMTGLVVLLFVVVAALIFYLTCSDSSGPTMDKEMKTSSASGSGSSQILRVQSSDTGSTQPISGDSQDSVTLQGAAAATPAIIQALDSSGSDLSGKTSAQLQSVVSARQHDSAGGNCATGTSLQAAIPGLGHASICAPSP